MIGHTWSREDADLIDDFFVAFIPGYEEDIVDSAVIIDAQIGSYRRDGKLDALIALIDDVTAWTSTDREVVDALFSVVGYSGLHDGPGYRPWLLALQARLHEGRDPRVVPDHPSPPLRWQAVLQREVWWADDALSNTVGDAVLDQCEEQCQGWVHEPGGWRRQHLYADLTELGKTIGTFGFSAPLTVIDRCRVPDPARTEPVTGAVVVLDLGYDSGEITSMVAYPERPLDLSLRAAYPDLCHWYGGYFYPTPFTPMLAMKAACRSTQDPARSRVREQLGMLLHEDDDTIQRVVEACGSYLLPPDIRHWVDRTLWRLDAFEWLGPDGELIRE